jgi:hypothetical protein
VVSTSRKKKTGVDPAPADTGVDETRHAATRVAPERRVDQTPSTRVGYAPRDAENNQGTAWRTGNTDDEASARAVSGAVAGGAAGAVVGTVVAGPAGTLVGGALGSAAGAIAGHAAGAKRAASATEDEPDEDAAGVDNADEDWVAKPAGEVRVHRTYDGKFYPEDSPADVKRRDQI